ncbi:glutamate receptor 1 [Drosophila guanche]|uniref:Blast:Probable glutamate receptor n=1 Tax=Drosophila guanche TaxID=7266 RepID=A0A3B0JUW8_DROGU|nr:glutamate receptor 1 [Drosophila guanche]SPP76531.1 blast:Probable glutamate receptor [Drosophila guanche]
MKVQLIRWHRLLLLLVVNAWPRCVSASWQDNSNIREGAPAPWGNQLPDMLAAYYRHHGVHSLMLVVCQTDIADSRLRMLWQHFNLNNIYVQVSTEQTLRDLRHVVALDELREAPPPQSFNANNSSHWQTSFQLPMLPYKLGILLLEFSSSCAQNLLRWSAATEHNYFTTNRFWLLLTEDLGDIDLLHDAEMFIPPDSELRVLHYSQVEGNFSASLIDLYKVAAWKPPKQTLVGQHLRSARHISHALRHFGSAITYRQNLEGIVFNTAIVIAFPDLFTNIEDLSLRHIDTISKVNHRLLVELANRLNMSYNTYQTVNYGWRQANGSFDGLMGRFQRYELDFAQLAIFMRLDRIALCDFVAETYRVRAGIMFRQPPLSAVANIFAMPFENDVWASILFLLIITTVVLVLELLFSPHTHDMAYMDTLNFVWGAMCQQGFYVEVRNRSARIIVFTTFVAALFLFTSFSANIVALLQSPSDSIKTLADLGQSPLEIGVQDTQYNKIYFTESTDPVTKNLYHKKIASKGDHVYMRPILGMEKMRTGLFAYQVELQAGYQIVSDTFSEPEKCGLMELEPFQLPMLAIPTRKNFPYKELIRRQIRWQREVSLVNREDRKWIPQKPKCEGGMGGFVSIGLTECRYALGIFGCGAAASFGVFLWEFILKHFRGVVRMRH